MQKIDSKSIVFIHGLFMNSRSWENWVKFFEEKGYRCYAPSYPYHEGNPNFLRNSFDKNLGKLNFQDVLDFFISYVDKLPEKPILIGHSIGGLLVQKLINLDYGVAGISIDPAPPEGIQSFKWSFLKANFPTINPLKGDSVCLPSIEWFQYAFCNLMTVEQTSIEYNKFVVPESRNIPRSTTRGGSAKIDFKKPHSPLLIIAGEKDHIIPASLNKKNFEMYKSKNSDQNSKTDFKEFKDRTHYICGQKNWEEVASYINEWINNLK